MERSRTTDMCTLAFPQALGTGIVVQVQLRMTDSAESDNQHANLTSQMTDSAESDNHTPKTTSQMTDSAEPDMREPRSPTPGRIRERFTGGRRGMAVWNGMGAR